MSADLAPAGWYSVADGKLRYWDGTAWTQHFAAGGQRGGTDGDSSRTRMQTTKREPSVQPADEPAPFAAGRNAAAQIGREGKHVDKGLDWGMDLLLVILGPVLPTLIAPALLDATGSGWLAVALATFTWTVGWAAIWFLAFSGRAGGAPLFMGAGPLLFLFSASIATLIGQGELALVRDGTVSLAGIINNAMDAYGFVGALLGFGIGVWIGSRLAKHFPHEAT